MSRLSWTSIAPWHLENHRTSHIAHGWWLISTVAFLIALSLLPAWSQSSDPVSTSRQLNVIWPNAQEGKNNLQTILRKRPRFDINRANAADLAKVKVPVLVPEKLFDYDNFVVRADRSGVGYFANAKNKGLNVVVTGSRVVHDPNEQSPANKRFTTQIAGKYVVRRAEHGLNLGLTRYGIPYTITVDCESEKDSRCIGEQDIRALADSMIFIGGEP